MAKLQAECLLIGPEPACGISAEIAKKAVMDWTTETINILGSPYQDSKRKGDSYKDLLPEEPRDC
jgi:hypothetical protein